MCGLMSDLVICKFSRKIMVLNQTQTQTLSHQNFLQCSLNRTLWWPLIRPTTVPCMKTSASLCNLVHPCFLLSTCPTHSSMQWQRRQRHYLICFTDQYYLGPGLTATACNMNNISNTEAPKHTAIRQLIHSLLLPIFESYTRQQTENSIREICTGENRLKSYSSQ